MATRSYFLGYTNVAQTDYVRREGRGRRMADITSRRELTHERHQQISLLTSCFEAMTGSAFTATAYSMVR